MRKTTTVFGTLIASAVAWLALHAQPAQQVFTITPDTGTTADKIKAERLVCSGPTAVDMRDGNTITVTLAPGDYTCKAQTIGAFDCSIQTAEGGVWTMTVPDAMGFSHMLRNGMETGGLGPSLALINAGQPNETLYAVGTDGNPYQWNATTGWSQTSAPAITADTPQIFAPSVAGECASPFTADLKFNVPPSLLQRLHLAPKAPTLKRG